MISVLALSGCAAAGSGGGGELSYEDSPLGTYTTALYGDIDQEKFEAQQAEVEELVAACMKEEGFEYLPNTQNGGGVVMSSDDMEDRETEEWVASNGYGMIQSAEQMAEQQAQSEELVDPNAEYTASLSESEASTPASNEAPMSDALSTSARAFGSRRLMRSASSSATSARGDARRTFSASK